MGEENMKLIILLGLFLSMNSFAQNDAKIDALTKRIEQLEKQQEDLLLGQEGRSNQANSFLKDNLTFGGFFESAFTAIDGPDTRFQAMHTGSTMGLNLSAEFSEKLRFVTQTWTLLSYPIQNPHNDARATSPTPKERKYGSPFFGSIVTAGYLETPLSTSTVLQVGVGYVPFGYAAQQRELVLFIRRGGPQLLRINTIFQPLWSGVHLAGNFRETNAGYNLYTMNSIDENANMSGVGGRAWVNSAEDKIKFGVSSQVMKYGGHTSEILGSDLRMENEKFILTSEYAVHMTGEGKDPWSVYVEPALKIKDGEFLLFFFGDYLRNPLNKTGVTLDPITVMEIGAGVNWLPTSNTRFRLQTAREDYLGSKSTILGSNRDFYYVDISAAVAF